MFPAQALAEAMIAKGWRVTLSTDARGARYAGGFPKAVAVEQVASATFARGGLLARALVVLLGLVALETLRIHGSGNQIIWLNHRGNILAPGSCGITVVDNN